MDAMILSGLQGAGKSTFCRERFWDSHVRINYDMLRTRHRESMILGACIAARLSFVVDATNPTALERARYIIPARAAGFRIVGYQFHVDVDLAVLRNARRSGGKCVPEKAIRATRNRLESLAFAEGFDEILDVFVTHEGLEMRERAHAL